MFMNIFTFLKVGYFINLISFSRAFDFSNFDRFKKMLQNKMKWTLDALQHIKSCSKTQRPTQQIVIAILKKLFVNWRRQFTPLLFVCYLFKCFFAFHLWLLSSGQRQENWTFYYNCGFLYRSSVIEVK